MNEGTKIVDNLITNSTLIAENAKKEIVMPSPILSINGKGVLYPNELCVLQGQTGVFKSTLLQTLAGVCLNGHCSDNERYLGFSANHEPNYVSLIDTERNMTYRIPFGIQFIKRLIDVPIEQDLEHFSATSFYNVSRTDRLLALEQWMGYIIEQADTRHPILLIDVGTDVISDFNSINQVYKFIDLLVKYKEEYGITFICTIHENPFSEKPRGHAGTEISNKASCVMQAQYDHDTRQGEIKFKKTSMSQRPDDVSFQFKNGFLLSANPRPVLMPNERKIIAKLFSNQTETYAHTELVEQLQDNELCGKTRGKPTLRTLKDKRIITQHFTGEYALHPSLKDKEL